MNDNNGSLPKPGNADSEAKPLTLIQELRQVEGALAMSRQYRMAEAVKRGIELIQAQAEHIAKTENKREPMGEDDLDEVDLD